MKNGIKKILNGVDKKKAAEMVKRYASKHAGQPGVIKSVWFNLDQLDKMIATLKKERIENGDEGRRYGIRIYMGTYGQGSMHRNINAADRNYSNKDTVLMVSTRQGEKDGEDKFNVDYFTEYDASLKVTPIENHGELCPEDCAGSDPDFS